MKMNKHRRVASLLISVILASSIVLPMNGEAASYKQNDARTYDDYDTKASWASAMRHFVSKGQINTYTSHPDTGKQGHWLHPSGGMTEGQLLYVLTKSLYPREYKNTKPSKGIAYSVAYKVAAEHELDTKATLTKNRKMVTKTMTRGEYAKILASVYYKKKVSQDRAITFMYQERITDGFKDGDGDYLRTFASYGKNYKVDRGNGFEMMNRFYKSLKPKSKISTLYGKHDYGSLNQKEYDTVIKIAKEKLVGVENGPYAQSKIAEKAYSDFLDGVEPIRDRANPKFRSEYNMALLYGYNNLMTVKESGLSKKEIIQYWRIQYAYATVDAGTEPGTGAPYSAYDALVRKTMDCDALAQVMNLFFDIMGYNTAILARPGHAFEEIKINGKWRNPTYLYPVDMSDYRNNVNGLRVVSEPTYGY